MLKNLEALKLSGDGNNKKCLLQDILKEKGWENGKSTGWGLAAEPGQN